MRIAYIINSVEGGGAALPVPDIAHVLRRHGHDVRIFALTRRDGRAIAPIRAAGFDVEICPGGPRDHLTALRWLGRKLAGWSPTHLWTSLTRATLFGQIAGQRLGLPVISWQHSARLKRGNAVLLRARKARSILWLADSASVARQTGITLGIPPARLMTWPIFRADPALPVASPWRAGDVLRIGTLGRLHPVKGFDTLIEALALLRTAPGLPALHVAIAGDGDERGPLQALADARGVAITFTGYCDDPTAFLRGLHLYVQPSHWEGLCLAAHEAMMCGLPIIASDAGEIPHTVLPGRTGLIVPPKNPPALAQALFRMLQAPEHLAGMGAAGRARVLERFGTDAFEAAGRAVLDRISRLTS